MGGSSTAASSAPDTELSVGSAEKTKPATTDAAPINSHVPINQIRLSLIPKYDGSPYIVINENRPYFSEEDLVTENFERYSELDELGRAGVACANISRRIMPTEERGPIGMIRPSGWQLIKYDNVDGRYLYNRCHLIAYQLAGENANELNLITGTRYLNTQGMLPFENEVADFATETGKHVLYRVTPMYEGDNLVASGVLIEAQSVEDNGSGVCFNVFCYNVQPGIAINYADGTSTYLGENGAVDLPERVDTTSQGSEINKNDDTTAQPERESKYMINTNTGKFHYASCSSVNDMSEKNKLPSNETTEEIQARGYVPCSICRP